MGDNGNDLACYDLDAANMTIRAKNLLGFSKNVICQESTLPGYLTLLGTGKVIASSNGPVHFLELPCRVDEQAVLGWADCPSPSYRYDYEHVKGFVSTVGALTGFTLSGEEKQVDFTGAGTVLVQSSELGTEWQFDLVALAGAVADAGQGRIEPAGHVGAAAQPAAPLRVPAALAVHCGLLGHRLYRVHPHRPHHTSHQQANRRHFQHPRELAVIHKAIQQREQGFEQDQLAATG